MSFKVIAIEEILSECFGLHRGQSSAPLTWFVPKWLTPTMDMSLWLFGLFSLVLRSGLYLFCGFCKVYTFFFFCKNLCHFPPGLFCILEMVLGLIDWYFSPLRLAYSYLVPFHQKDVLDEVDFHSWTVFLQSPKEGGLFETILFPCPCTSCQSPSEVILLSASSWVCCSCYLKHWRNVMGCLWN